jgi:hypothetical protein
MFPLQRKSLPYSREKKEHDFVPQFLVIQADRVSTQRSAELAMISRRVNVKLFIHDL